MVTRRIQGACNVEVESCARAFIEVHALGSGLRAIGGRHQSSCLAAAFPSDGEGVALPGGNRSRRAGSDQKISSAVSFRRELEIAARFSGVLADALPDKMAHHRDRYPGV
jgi:hypothetical protein